MIRGFFLVSEWYKLIRVKFCCEECGVSVRDVLGRRALGPRAWGNASFW